MAQLPLAPPDTDLREAVFGLSREIESKMVQRQSGVPTFCDHAILEFVRVLRGFSGEITLQEAIEYQDDEARTYFEEGLRWITRLIARTAQGRFVSLADRYRGAPVDKRFDREVDYLQLMSSQGVIDCLQWRGQPLFKTVYDFSIYTMLLWNLKPRTILEIGSGVGTSAVWMADLLRTFGLEAHVYSMDIKKPDLAVPGVTFMQGDCWKIADALPGSFLAGLPHPVLVIEDAHENTFGVLDYLHGYAQPGDYLVVEDSDSKKDDLLRLTAKYAAAYRLDTYYLDFYGRNACSACDSIFVRT